MPAPHSLDGGTDHLPRHMRCAQGQNLDWKSGAKCRNAAGVPMMAWHVDRKDSKTKLMGRPATAWIALALAICETCPVQWDCARFALAVGEKWHTWGMDVDDLRWLSTQREADRVVSMAEEHGVPVQVAVRRYRYGT